MTTATVNDWDRVLAKVCLNCPVCRYARRTQAGLVFRFVQKVEGRVCPFCQAYERVYGQKPHAPMAPRR